jgi:hypothetical protein
VGQFRTLAKHIDKDLIAKIKDGRQKRLLDAKANARRAKPERTKFPKANTSYRGAIRRAEVEEGLRKEERVIRHRQAKTKEPTILGFGYGVKMNRRDDLPKAKSYDDARRLPRQPKKDRTPARNPNIAISNFGVSGLLQGLIMRYLSR